MPLDSKKLPVGNFTSEPSLPFSASASPPIRSAAELGELVRKRRRQQSLTQQDLAGLGNTGNRFIVDLENGKPTVQLQKVLDLLNLLGLEMVVQPRTGRGL